MSFFSHLGKKNPEQRQRWFYRCHSCSCLVTEGRFFPELDVAFCPSCFDTKLCSCCNLPCGPNRKKLTDGRVICNQCHSTAVISLRQLSPLYDTTLRFLNRKLKFGLKRHPRLRLVDRRYIKQQKWSENTLGAFCTEENGEYIYILNGISKEMALVTLAHELTHYWQQKNCPRGQSVRLYEGFAVWVSFRLAEQEACLQGMLSLKKNEIEPYQSGLLEMLVKEKQWGRKKLLKAIRTRHSLP